MATTVALTTEQARDLTDRIGASIEHTWVLLAEAHDGQAWLVLGYESWGDYVTAEFAMTRRRSYQLLDQAHVIKELTKAAGLCTDVHITEGKARRVKEILDPVAAVVRDEVHGKPQVDRPRIVDEVVDRSIKNHKDAASRLRPPDTPIEVRATEKKTRQTARATPIQLRLFAVIDELQPRVEEAAKGLGITSEQWLRDAVRRHLDRTALKANVSNQVTPHFKR